MMQIDLQTGALYTDAGEYLKTLQCPVRANWNGMASQGDLARLCAMCNKLVHDTAGMADQDLRDLLTSEPDACLTVSLAQNNCNVRHRSIIRR